MCRLAFLWGACVVRISLHELGQICPPDAQQLRSIARIVAQRGIRQLCHFTDIRNLPGIAAHGILPLSALRSKMGDLSFHPTDDARVSGGHEGISVSISWPNCKMLAAKRNQTDSSVPSRHFALLVLDPIILTTARFLAYPTNSARSGKGLPGLLEHAGPEALERLFMNGHLRSSQFFADRRLLHLADSEPTDPQAELVFLDRIPRARITGISSGSSVAPRIAAFLKASGWRVQQRIVDDDLRTWNRPDWKSWIRQSIDEARLVREGERCGCSSCL